jgi:hypothetical protein
LNKLGGLREKAHGQGKTEIETIRFSEENKGIEGGFR